MDGPTDWQIDLTDWSIDSLLDWYLWRTDLLRKWANEWFLIDWFDQTEMNWLIHFSLLAWMISIIHGFTEWVGEWFLIDWFDWIELPACLLDWLIDWLIDWLMYSRVVPGGQRLSRWLRPLSTLPSWSIPATQRVSDLWPLPYQYVDRRYRGQ